MDFYYITIYHPVQASYATVLCSTGTPEGLRAAGQVVGYLERVALRAARTIACAGVSAQS